MNKQIELIWSEFSQALKRFILKSVADEQTAEDILQDVFIKIHSHIGTLNDDSKLQSWIYQITRNAISDYYRRPQVVQALHENLVVSTEEADEVVGQLATSVRAMMAQLPDEYRLPLMLTTFEGLSQQEMGERLGLSLSAAKSRVQRAREKLRDLFLDCCHFEFDRLGKVINYYPRADCCSQCSQCCAPTHSPAV